MKGRQEQLNELIGGQSYRTKFAVNSLDQKPNLAHSNCLVRLIHLLNHLPIDQKMALIIHCVEENSYSVFVL